VLTVFVVVGLVVTATGVYLSTVRK